MAARPRRPSTTGSDYGDGVITTEVGDFVELDLDEEQAFSRVLLEKCIS